MNIFAYTAEGADFPEFISVNAREGQCEISLRSPKPDGFTATMVLPNDQINELCNRLKEWDLAQRRTPAAHERVAAKMGKVTVFPGERS